MVITNMSSYFTFKKHHVTSATFSHKKDAGKIWVRTKIMNDCCGKVTPQGMIYAI